MFGMGHHASLMLGNWKDGAMLLLHGLCFNFYLFALLFSGWQPILVKGYLYGFMSIITIYLALSPSSQLNLINKLCFAFNFALFFLTLLGLFDNSIFYMVLYNGLIFVLTSIVLTSGSRHGYFKTQYEND